jgi:hypothetical protein
MLLGYETVNIDSPNYGKKFWELWNAGKGVDGKPPGPLAVLGLMQVGIILVLTRLHL